jgi:N-acetylglucosamine-6-sulfatase
MPRATPGAIPFLDTPNIDRIRYEGVLFSNAFVPTSICVPSRASLLTGAYPSRHGVTQNAAGEYDALATPPFPLVLQQHGYHTAHVGKWHMLNTDTPRVGYDYWAAFAGQGPYFDP